jgi:predicted transcriptional regulator
MDILVFSVDDFHIFMSLLGNNGNFDNKYVLCRGTDLVEWGKELFELHLEYSTPVTEI